MIFEYSYWGLSPVIPGQEGIDAVTAIDEPQKMDSGGSNALNKLRIGAVGLGRPGAAGVISRMFGWWFSWNMTQWVDK